jgi:hypothetical protein
MEENNDTIVVKKKDIIRAVIYSLPGIAVTLFGLVELLMITNWGSVHHVASPDAPVLYAILYLMVISFAALAVFIGLVWFDIGQIKYRIAKMEETLIQEIREVRNLDENVP